jgi:hypothetical protein
VRKRKRPPRRARASAGTVLVVNMIPKSRSGEEHQDSEPSIAVNPADPSQIAGSAFTPDPSGGPRAPIYVSADGGRTWVLNSIVPGNDPGSGTNDITLQFGGTSNVLYAGILRPTSTDDTRLNILRTSSYADPIPMTVLINRSSGGIDQPYVRATTVASGPDKGKDRLYVGDNYSTLSSGRTATIDQSLDAAASAPTFKSVRIEPRATAGQDGPPVRPAIHSDGTVYAAYHAWRSFNDRTGAGVADVVVVRDDQGGSGAAPFTDLVDPADAAVGVRVVQGAKFNFDGFLGLQRTGGDVSIAVDPTDSDRVYLAYNDDQGPIYMLHLLRSTDRGRTWSSDLRTHHNALNPALAVNGEGTVGLLYQQLTGSGAAERWVTTLETQKRHGGAWKRVVLATTPASTPAKQFDPYLGDYDHLTAVGKDFLGVFSANNTPRKSNFPHGVTYQRNANFATNTLLDVDNVTPVKPSIDPFFFKVAG